MFEAMKINADSYNAYRVLMGAGSTLLMTVNGSFLVREIGTGSTQLRIYDEHDFRSMFRFKKPPVIAAFTPVHVLSVNEADELPTPQPMTEAGTPVSPTARKYMGWSDTIGGPGIRG